MKQVLSRLGVAVSLAVLFTFSTAFAQNSKLNDPQIAAKLGITVQQVHSLRARFHLTDDTLLVLSPLDLQEMLDDLDHPGIEKHAAGVQFRALRMMDEHGKIPPDGLLRALEQRKHVGGDADLFPSAPDPSTNVPTSGDPGPQTAGIQTNGWTWLGPGNIGGRVRSIVIHPTTVSTMYCGGVDGGVWKTTNSGSSWFPLNDFMANLAVSCMVMDPTNPSVIYAGTGEATYNADAIRGAGIFKTVNGGTNWFQLSGTANASFLYVGRVAVDPNNSQILIAATRTGTWRSTNGGTNWSSSQATEVLCAAFHPTDSSQAICSGYNGHAYYSTDGGLTWNAASGLPAPSGFVVGRVELAYSRSSPTTVYASVDNNSGEVYRSTDGGHTFSLRNTGNNYMSSQGWYDNLVWADPVNSNVVIVGGTDVWRSTDGGATFTDIGGYSGSIHPDQHVIVASPLFDGSTVKTIFLGNDGGMWRATDAYAASSSSGWTTLNHNLGITQFYGGAGNSNTSVIVGGTQDNGDLRYTTGGGTEGWISWYGGDGGVSASDRTDPNYYYGEYVYLQIHRSANGASSGANIYSGISDAGSAANFIAPFILDPNTPTTLLGGGNSLWRTTNAKASLVSWSAIKPSISSPISAIAVAPGNSDIIWVGHNNGSVYSTANGTTSTPTWTVRSGLPARYCTRLAITPGNTNSVYATFGGYNSGNVWRSPDGGATWINVTANLPAAPVNSIVIAPADTNTLYVGTDVGVFGSSDNGAHWSTGNDGPANVAVDELFWLGPKLVAVTHGRGMFSITPLLGGVNLVANGAIISGGNGNGTVDPNECNQVTLAVQNVGGTVASNITATLTSSTPGVTIVQATSPYPNLTNGVTGTNATPFTITTSPALACGTSVAVTLNVFWTGGSNSIGYTLPSGGTNYVLTQTNAAAIVPGVADIGNHGDDAATAVTLPFPVTFYGQSYNSATVDSNGRLTFGTGSSAYQNACLPAGFPATIDALWDDLRTDGTGGGIFISTNGVAPNRIYNIEWRATYYSGGASANFEIRLYESQLRLDIIYGVLNDTGSSATVGIENSSSSYVQFECNSGGLSTGLQLTFQQSCTDGGGPCAPPPPVASFSGTPTSGAVPLTVTFTNSSSTATNYVWNFGDGSSSTTTNAVETYTNAGTYTVALTAIGPSGTNTLTKTNYITVTNVPPLITTQPQDQGVSLGGTASFSVTASGTLPLSYQWSHNGTNLPGATGTQYAITNAQFSDGGSYSVLVTNIAGSIASSPANLYVAYLFGFISITGDPWSETFDEMGANGTNTPPGWYVGAGTAEISSNVVAVGNGVSSLTRNYNFGATGAPDRALGSVGGSGSPRDTEGRFVNVSGTSIFSFNVSYTGEQWRFGGAGAVTNTLSMQYSTDGTNFNTMGSQFDFISPTLSSFSVALDGNNPTNRVVGIGGTYVPATPITNGQPFYLRWADADDSGPDMGLAIDDLTLTFSLSNAAPAVVADFSASPTNGGAPLTVLFTNLSAGATNYFWNFGDGNTSVFANPTNTYTNAGVYSVQLVAIGAGGTNILTRTNYVAVTNTPPPPVVADFAADPTNGLAPLTVVFTNLSTGATNFLWDFGDGNTSIVFNPTNSYTNSGSYSVTLAALGAAGTNFLTRTNYIVVTNAPPPPVLADFTGGPTNGVAPLTVTFTNFSTGATNFLWDFGDGNTSIVLNPTNSYTNFGSYSVTLAAVGPAGTNVLTRTNYIVVTNAPPPPVIANFAGVPTSGVAPLTVTFTNLSTGATSYLWDFGNGNASTLANPANSYTNPGSFSVTLTASSPGGTNVLTRTNYIIVTPPAVLLVSPAGLDFGLLATGATAQASLLVSNAGAGTLTGLASVAPSPFSIAFGTPFTLNSSDWTNVVVNFAPTNAGAFTNSVLFTSNGGVATNALSGRALYAPVIYPAPSAQAEFDFSFETFAGFIYNIQYKDSFTAPVWQTLETVPGDGSTKFITNSVASPDQRLYRLLIY